MAIYIKVAKAGKYQDENSINDVISYITRAVKTPNDMIGGRVIDPEHIAQSMIDVSERFGKNSRIRLHHFIVSLTVREARSKGIMISIAEEISSIIGEQFQVCYAIHEDTDYPHIHFVFNSISYINGFRYRGGKREYYNLYYVVRSVLYQYGIRDLIPGKFQPDPYNPHESIYEEKIYE